VAFKGKVHLGVEHMKAVFDAKNKERQQVITLTFSVKTTIDQIGRPLHWQKAGYPMYIDIGSDLLDDDIQVKKVNYQLDFLAEKKIPAAEVMLAEVKAAEVAIAGQGSTAAGLEAEANTSDNMVETKTEVQGVPSTESSAPEETTIATASASAEKGKRKRKSKKNSISPTEDVSVLCANCGYAASPAEVRSISETKEELCPACGNPFYAKSNHNGSSGNLEQTVECLDLSTFDMRPANGIAVPAKIFLLSKSEEDTEGGLQMACVRLFNQLGVTCKTPEELASLVKKYPQSEQRDMVIEILELGYSSNAEFNSLKSASEDYHAEKAGSGKAGKKGDTFIPVGDLKE
jgi:hypothetical protein